MYGQYKVVALDATLEEFGLQSVERDGEMLVYRPERTIKDCREIDGCIYFHKGRVTDAVMSDLIEKFQKLLADKEGWTENRTAAPDPKLKI